MAIRIADIERKSEGKRVVDIPIGTTFFGRVGHYSRDGGAYQLFLRGYGMLISLHDPTLTWDFAEDSNLPLEISEYTPVDISITIIYKEHSE